jgi:V8-like Glu-specific endopeptidase
VRYYPLTLAGRLFYNANGDRPGWGHICTAQFVAPNVILTASHCVQDETPPYEYHKNFMFYLEYERGTAAARYGFSCLGNLRGWAQQNPARYLYDYAMIQTDRAADVGWFGMQWNWLGLYSSATKIGYPSGSFKGEVIQVDGGPLSVADGIVELKHDNMHVQHGSSGGAWIGDYSTNPRDNTKNHIISSESFSRGEAGETSGISYGPYYTDAILPLFKYVRNGCQ